jgi:hypothetical protein
MKTKNLFFSKNHKKFVFPRIHGVHSSTSSVDKKPTINTLQKFQVQFQTSFLLWDVDQNYFDNGAWMCYGTNLIFRPLFSNPIHTCFVAFARMTKAVFHFKLIYHVLHILPHGTIIQYIKFAINQRTCKLQTNMLMW